MKKFSASGSEKLIIGYIIKAVLCAVLSLFLLTIVFSEIVYKFDLSLDYSEIFSIIICALTAFITAFFAVSRMRNNGALLGLICQLPLVFYMVINVIFNDNSIIMFIIKMVIVLLTGALSGFISVKRSRKIKV